jgi:hypothetical protein
MQVHSVMWCSVLLNRLSDASEGRNGTVIHHHGSVVLLCACTTSRPITLPDGSQGRMVGCSGVQHTMSSCYLKAGEICPNGYDIVGGGQGDGPNSTAAGLIGPYGSIDRELVVRCH